MLVDPKDRVRAQFGVSAEEYATSDLHARGDSLDALAALAGLRQDWRVLDVATGAGHTACALSPKVADVLALDLTEAMMVQAMRLAAAKRLRNVRGTVADAEFLPCLDGSFDLVTCRLAFHHFPEPNLAIREFRRVLKRGGILGLADNIVVEDAAAAAYYNTFEKLRDPSHHCVYPLSRIATMLSAERFEILETRRFSKELEFEEWADRQHVSQASKRLLRQMLRDVPESLRPLLSPREADGTIYFSLWEVVLCARLR